MLAEIPPPPVPPQTALLLAGACCLLAGGVLLFWGRSLGRVVLAMIAAGAAAAASRLLIPVIPYKNVWVVGLASAATAGLITFVLARLVWGLVLGALLAGLGVAVVGWLNAGGITDPPTWQGDQFTTFTGWCACMADYLWRWQWRLWQHNPLATASAGGALLLLAVVLSVLLPNATRIITSSILGAAGMVGGAGLFVWAGRPDWLAGWASYWYVPGVVAGVLAVVGLGLQGRTQLRIAAEMQKKKSDQEARERDKAGIAPARGRSDVDRHR